MTGVARLGAAPRVQRRSRSCDAAPPRRPRQGIRKRPIRARPITNADNTPGIVHASAGGGARPPPMLPYSRDRRSVIDLFGAYPYQAGMTPWQPIRRRETLDQLTGPRPRPSVCGTSETPWSQLPIPALVTVRAGGRLTVVRDHRSEPCSSLSPPSSTCSSRSRRAAATSTRSTTSAAGSGWTAPSSPRPSTRGLRVRRGTLGEDGDPLDALVVTVGEPLFPGVLVLCRTIGMFRMRDEAGGDDKLLCVPAHEPRWRTCATSTIYRSSIASRSSISSRSTRNSNRARTPTWVGRTAAEAELERSRRRLRESGT